MTREQVIAGLKEGRALYVDGAATPRERALIQELIDEGAATASFHEGEQYGFYKITLSKSKGGE